MIWTYAFISVKHSFPAFSKQYKTWCFAVAKGYKILWDWNFKIEIIGVKIILIRFAFCDYFICFKEELSQHCIKMYMFLAFHRSWGFFSVRSDLRICSRYHKNLLQAHSVASELTLNASTGISKLSLFTVCSRTVLGFVAFSWLENLWDLSILVKGCSSRWRLVRSMVFFDYLCISKRFDVGP